MYFCDNIERAFILDWKSPAGFSRVLVPRYIDWRHDAHFGGNPAPIPHAHDIGSKNWFQMQNRSVSFYTDTDFRTYFSNTKEVVQSHSYDFTYAILRNKHLRRKAREMGLLNAKCRLCCIWHYLFKYSPSFVRNSASVASKRLRLRPDRDVVFVDLSLPSKYELLPWNLMKRRAEEVLGCVRKVEAVLHNPACIVASNNYVLLEEVGTIFPRALTNGGLFFTRERYQVELNRWINVTSAGVLDTSNNVNPADRSSSSSSVVIPRTEHNALMYFFMGYYLQLNSTVLVTSRKSPYSETMAAMRHYYHPTSTYVVRPETSCKLERYL